MFEQPDFSKLGGEQVGATADPGEIDEVDEVDPAAGSEEIDDPLDENVAPGSAARAVLEHVAASIVDDKGAVVVESKEVRGQTRLYLHVSPNDMGRIIGRRGRTAQAVRTLVRAAGATENRDVFVEIVD